MLDQITGDETLLKRGVVVARDKDLDGNRKGGEPVDESSELGLVSIRILPVRRVTAVDHHVDVGRYREQVVLHVRV